MAKEVYTTLEGGGILWNASGVLGEYLAAKRKEDIAGKHVLELGAGLGHLSLALARMGAHVTTTESACEKGGGDACACWGCLEQLRRSLVSQLGEGHDALDAGKRVKVARGEGSSGAEGSVRVVELAWGPEAYQRPGALKAEADGGEKVEGLVMSEVVYNQAEESLYDDEFHDNLAWTVEKFLSRPGAVGYNVFVDRPFSFMFFAKLQELPGRPFEVRFTFTGSCDARRKRHH
ncbi:hypothetical protein T484DRAFT_1927353, partial [Baffinella frigidus]